MSYDSNTGWPTSHGQRDARWGGRLDGVPNTQPSWHYFDEAARAAVFGHMVVTDTRIVFVDDTYGVTALNLATRALDWEFRPSQRNLLAGVAASGDFMLADKWLLDAATGEIQVSLEELAGDITLARTPPKAGGRWMYRAVEPRSARGQFFRVDSDNGDVEIIQLPFVYFGLLEEEGIIAGYDGMPPNARLNAFDVVSQRTVWSSEPIEMAGPIMTTGDLVCMAGRERFSMLNAESGDVLFTAPFADFAPQLAMQEKSTVKAALAPDTAHFHSGRRTASFDIPSMSFLWSRELPVDVMSMTGAGDLLFIALTNNTLFGLDRRTGEEVWRSDVEMNWSSVQACGRHVVAACLTGHVVCFECPTQA